MRMIQIIKDEWGSYWTNTVNHFFEYRVDGRMRFVSSCGRSTGMEFPMDVSERNLRDCRLCTKFKDRRES